MTDDVTSTPGSEDAGDAERGGRSDATERLLGVLGDFGGETLRDAWLFDQWTYECIYVRDDVAERLEGVDPEGFIDNERYGYVTKDTYEDMFDEPYAYTVRGFPDFEQFRTFIQGDGERVGLFVGYDRVDGGHDFARLHEAIGEVTDDYPVEEFTPAGEFE